MIEDKADEVQRDSVIRQRDIHTNFRSSGINANRASISHSAEFSENSSRFEPFYTFPF